MRFNGGCALLLLSLSLCCAPALAGQGNVQVDVGVLESLGPLPAFGESPAVPADPQPAPPIAAADDEGYATPPPIAAASRSAPAAPSQPAAGVGQAPAYQFPVLPSQKIYGSQAGAAPAMASASASPQEPAASKAVSGRDGGIGEVGISVAAYGGQLAGGNFTDFFYKPWSVPFESTNFAALSAAYRFYRFHFGLSFEAEVGVGRRFSGEDMWEFWTALALRWDNFPWNDFVQTTVGLAFFGPNYTSKVSPHEKDRNDGKETQWMNIFAPEITLAHPDLPQAALMLRLHHRSGVFGLYNDTSSGSTFVTGGLRYFF